VLLRGLPELEICCLIGANATIFSESNRNESPLESRAHVGVISQDVEDVETLSVISRVFQFSSIVFSTNHPVRTSKDAQASRDGTGN